MSGETRLKPEWVIERQGKKAVLYAGLLHLAHEAGLKGITVTLVQCPTDLNGNRAICAASVEMPEGVFSDVGDADATNVTPFVIPHLVRMAATRAKARALRDALDIGYVAAEELTDIEALGGTDSRAPSGSFRRPSVGVQAGQRVDQDAGRPAPPPAGAQWPLNGGPVPDVDTLSHLPATDRQRQALHKWGIKELPDDLTRARASEILSDLVARKGGA